MTESEIIHVVTSSFTGVDTVVASEANGAPEVSWGDTFFFYDPGGDVPADRRFPFATIVTNDYEGFDTLSNLNRPGVFRLNVAVSKETFGRLFGDHKGTKHDFAALDTPLPHPVYGAQSWVSILNPGPNAAELARMLLAGTVVLAPKGRTRLRSSGAGSPLAAAGRSEDPADVEQVVLALVDCVAG